MDFLYLLANAYYLILYLIFKTVLKYFVIRQYHDTSVKERTRKKIVGVYPPEHSTPPKYATEHIYKFFKYLIIPT